MKPSTFLLFLLPIVLTASCAPRPGSTIDSGNETLRILAYNIHHGEGMDEILDLERIAALITEVDPDVVTLQEIDSVATRTDGINQARVLGELTRMAHVFGRFMEYQGGAYGMAVLSRWPIIEEHNYRLPDGAEPRSALTVTVESPMGTHVRVADIHFYRTEEERLAQAESLLSHLGNTNVPTILSGDFNSEPGTEVMSYFAANDWRIIDKDEDSNTFPSYAPEKEIDYMLLKPASSFKVVRHNTIDEPVASDHSPLVLDVELVAPLAGSLR